jgi:hypothetical protein
MVADASKEETIRSVAKGIIYAVLGVVGLMILLAVALPNYINPPITGSPRGVPRIACINNLRQIDAAKEEWAIQTHAPSNAVPTWEDIRPYLQLGGTNGVIPKCAEGGLYTIGALTDAPTCSTKGHALQ